MSDTDKSESSGKINVAPEDIAKAEEIKNKANEYFASGKYGKAIQEYDEAIKLNPYSAIYFSNRAFSYQKLEQFGAALTDASKAIELDKTYAKAYYRRGSALVALGKYKDGYKDFKQVVAIFPKNKEAQDKLKQCDKVLKRLAFEDAIKVEENEEPEVVVDPNTIEIESSYGGVHLPEPITKDFILSLISDFKLQKKLHIKYVFKMLLEIKKIFSSLDSLIEIEVPESNHINVCGDVHGQFFDLCNIFELKGYPSESNPFLFNGDFVDRGSFSVEVILTLFAFKLLYPRHLHLLRGNHESLTMNRMYGFEGEVVAKYNKKIFEVFTDVFNYLPLAAVINKKVIIVHGGLFSKEGVTLNDIRKINRVRQPPDEGLMCELLWSDPQPFPGRSPNKRGVGVAFGPDVTHRFLADNNLELIVRSHEVKEEGYLVEADGKLVTVFSAPNYCDSVGNKGAVITFDSSMKPSYTSFREVPHPAVKPMAYASQFNMFF